MPIIASAKSGGNFTPISEGVHCAACISIIDIGVQISEKFGNKQHKIMITWEFPDEMIEIEGESKPRVLSKEYTLSLSEKASLRAHLEAWRGKKFTETELEGFDLKNILGKTCQIQIIHTEKGGNTYANVAALMALPKGMPQLKPISEVLYFDLSSERALDEISTLPEWIQDKVKTSETYHDLIKTQLDSRPASDNVADDYTEVTGDDDLPF
jgi:hypothetical protein